MNGKSCIAQYGCSSKGSLSILHPITNGYCHQPPTKMKEIIDVLHTQNDASPFSPSSALQPLTWKPVNLRHLIGHLKSFIALCIVLYFFVFNGMNFMPYLIMLRFHLVFSCILHRGHTVVLTWRNIAWHWLYIDRNTLKGWNWKFPNPAISPSNTAYSTPVCVSATCSKILTFLTRGNSH